MTVDYIVNVPVTNYDRSASFSTHRPDSREVFFTWWKMQQAIDDAERRIAEDRPYEDAITAEEFEAKYLHGR